MKRIITMCFLLSVLLIQDVLAQALPDRYRTEIFTNAQLTVTNNVVFSTNIPHVQTTNLFGNQIANEESYGSVTVTLRMDIYRPNNTVDTLTKRPVIIFCFGGGFVTGSRTETSMIQLCQSFARRGFVTATIDYRLGMNISDEELAKRAVYRGLQDGRSAVRFFRNNANTYRIDPNQVYIAGHSAGAFIALHNIYLDRDAERPASTRLYMVTRPDLGGLDAIGDNKTDANGNPISGKANAAMGFAGALGDVNYIENAGDAPGVYFHSSDDDVIPYNSGEPFSNLNWIPGINLPTVYGSNQLNIRAGNVGAPRVFYPYTNRGHGVHFDGSNLYSDITPRGSTFFYDYRLKPLATSMSGNATVCSNDLTQTYALNLNSDFYFDWQVVGGTINTTNYAYKNAISVTWNPAAPTRSITCTPYSRQLARAASPISKTITINQIPNIGTPITDRLYQISDGSPTINLAGAFIDPEAQAMTYTASASVAGVVNPTVSGNILTMNIVGAGSTTITVEATDAGGCKRSQTFQVVVNRPPTVVQNISNQEIYYAESPFVIENLASLFADPDGDAMTYTLSESPAGVVVVERSGNQVTFTASQINTTTITITANDGRGGTVSMNFTITVHKGSQVITFEPISNKYVDESPVSLVASSNRNLPITFSIVAGNAILTGNSLTFNQLGSITVRASQAGNDYFNAASPVEQTFLVIKRDQTITFEPISDKILTENSFDLQASASSNLPIQFELVEGDATLNNKTLTFNKIGFITVRATQPGNNVYNAAEPVERTFYVAPEGLQLQVSPNPFRDRIKMTLQGKYTGNVEIWVYDALGRTVLKGNFEKTTLRYDGVYILDAQPKEIYFLRVTTKEKEFIQKIVKQ
jgi:acetyl esterase/lipase